MIDKGKVIMLLKGYATDGKDKTNTSIDYDRIEELAADIVKLFAIPDVRLSFADLKDEILKYKAKSEYQQASIVILRNIFKAHEA